VVEVVLEECKISQLWAHSLADINVCDSGLLIEFGIVHREVDGLLIIHYGDQLSSGQVWLVVLNDQHIPLVHLDVSYLHSVALHSRWTIIFGQNSVNDLIAGIEVALEATISFSKTIEKYRQIHRIKVLRTLIFCLITWCKYATLDLDAFEFDGGCVSLLKGPDSWGDDWAAISLPLLLRLLIEFKSTFASWKVKVILDLLILILKSGCRVQYILTIASQTAHNIESKGQDTLQLLLLLLDDLLLECYLVIGLVRLELFFHFSDFLLHHNDFAALLFDKLDQEFQMLSLVSITLREDMTKLRYSAAGVR
jgi:hypothetical protein